VGQRIQALAIIAASSDSDSEEKQRVTVSRTSLRDRVWVEGERQRTTRRQQSALTVLFWKVFWDRGNKVGLIVGYNAWQRSYSVQYYDGVQMEHRMDTLKYR